MSTRKIQIGAMAVLALMVTVCGCGKKKQLESPIVGHWGCEQYVSCRTDSLGVETWDTSWFAVGEGCEYELFFNADGTGLLKLNNSPAFIKEFSCKYEYNSVAQVIAIESSSWLYALYGSLFLDENHAEFNVESMTSSAFEASWTNHLSEPKPFFERFFIKRID